LTPAPVTHRWYHKLGALLLANFCFVIGVVLAVFPWLDWWEANYFSGFSPAWRQIWLNPYLRGAVSGIGLLNVYISFVEIFRLRRFSG
jgi:hypothetical protein